MGVIMWAQFERFAIQMTKEQALSAAHQGRCDEDVVELMKHPKIKRQIDKLDPELVRDELWEYGAWDDAVPWGICKGIHRDSDLLDQSNWRVIVDSLEAHDLLGEEGKPFRVVGFSHWAVGWIDHLLVDTRDTKALQWVAGWQRMLDIYPSLDDEYWSYLETERADKFWEGMSVKERVEALQEYAPEVSIFAARRDYVPTNDGGLDEYLRGY